MRSSPSPALCLHGSAAFALALLAISPAAHATMVVVPSLEEMVVQAEVIAHVTVKAQRVDKDGRGRIMTLTTLDVVEPVKGAKAGESLEVFQIGGVVDGKGSWVSGAHRFEIGEELVFVGVRHNRGPGSVIPFGIGYGLFAVERDDFGARIVEVVGDVVAVDKAPDGTTRTAHPAPRTYDSLPGFLGLLRRLSTADLEQAPATTRIERRPTRGAPVPAPLAPTTPAPSKEGR